MAKRSTGGKRRRSKGGKVKPSSPVCDGRMVSLSRQAILKQRAYRRRDEVRTSDEQAIRSQLADRLQAESPSSVRSVIAAAFAVAHPAEGSADALDEHVSGCWAEWTSLKPDELSNPQQLLREFMQSNRHLRFQAGVVMTHMAGLPSSSVAPPLVQHLALEACKAYRDVIDQTVNNPRSLKDARRQAAEGALCAQLAALRFMSSAARSRTRSAELVSAADHLRRQ